MEVNKVTDEVYDKAVDEVDDEAEMEKAIKIAQIQKRPKNISINKFATKQRK